MCSIKQWRSGRVVLTSVEHCKPKAMLATMDHEWLKSSQPRFQEIDAAAFKSAKYQRLNFRLNNAGRRRATNAAYPAEHGIVRGSWRTRQPTNMLSVKNQKSDVSLAFNRSQLYLIQLTAAFNSSAAYWWWRARRQSKWAALRWTV